MGISLAILSDLHLILYMRVCFKTSRLPDFTMTAIGVEEAKLMLDSIYDIL